MRPSGIHGRRREPRTAILATQQCGYAKGLGSDKMVTTVTGVVEGCSFGNMAEAFGAAATQDCSNRLQP
jgi:hypothetical protein